MIAILDYGMGNLRCAQKALEYIGEKAIISDRPDEISKADRLVLPGVGAFRDSIAGLRKSGLDQVFVDAVKSNKPALGICLGMQLLFSASSEGQRYEGLNLLQGEIRLVEPHGLKIPQIGWNQVRAVQDSPLLAGLDGEDFYFAHSYCAPDIDAGYCVGLTNYGQDFVSVAGSQTGPLFGTQFHPEKSGDAGLALLRNFARL